MLLFTFLVKLGYMNEIPETAEFITINQFAIKVQVHPNTVRRAIRKGRVAAIRICTGKKILYRIPRSELTRVSLQDMEELIEKIIEKRCNPPSPPSN